MNRLYHNKGIYLDYAATTPIDERVLEVMMPYLTTEFGNASSLHSMGQRARHAVDSSREKIAAIIGAKQSDIIFTSGGTESNNLFITGVGEFVLKNMVDIKNPQFVPHIITTKIEHESVLRPIEELAKKGFAVTYLDVGADGVLNVEDLKKALRPETVFVSIMYANNEIGTVQPVRECAQVINEFRSSLPVPPHSSPPPILFHTDACQAASYLSLNIEELGVDAMTLNSGKIYGPKGVGCLYVRGGAHGSVKLMPQFLGGGQEYRMRSGTENVAGIVGFATALELAQKTRVEESARQLILRDMLIDGILALPNTRINGSREKRLPNNVNVSFKGLHGEAILTRLDMSGIFASSGSACSSGSLEPSHVIAALGKDAADDIWSRSATRFSLGRFTTKEEVLNASRELSTIISELSDTNPFS